MQYKRDSKVFYQNISLCINMFCFVCFCFFHFLTIFTFLKHISNSLRLKTKEITTVTTFQYLIIISMDFYEFNCPFSSMLLFFSLKLTLDRFSGANSKTVAVIVTYQLHFNNYFLCYFLKSTCNQYNTSPVINL